MTKEQILDLIKSQEAEMYKEFIELRKAYGPENSGTKHAGAQWNAISNLLDIIEDENN